MKKSDVYRVMIDGLMGVYSTTQCFTPLTDRSSSPYLLLFTAEGWEDQAFRIKKWGGYCMSGFDEESSLDRVDFLL